MKNFKFLFMVISSIMIISCGSDDDAAGTVYPITLNFTSVTETFTYYQDGAETTVTDAILTSYNDSAVSLSAAELVAESTGDYFKFLSDTEVELSEGGEVIKAPYVFEDGFLYLGTGQDRLLYGQGDLTKLEYRLSALRTNTAGSSGGYEDEGDIEFFPATFENSVDFHNYTNVEEIQGDEFLLIHNLSIVYE